VQKILISGPATVLLVDLAPTAAEGQVPTSRISPGWNIVVELQSSHDASIPSRAIRGNPEDDSSRAANRTQLGELQVFMTRELGRGGAVTLAEPSTPESGENPYSLRGGSANGLVRMMEQYVLPTDAVLVVPAPRQAVTVGWQSPITGVVRIRGRLTDLDRKSGHGDSWVIAHDDAILASGAIARGKTQDFEDGAGATSLAKVSVGTGDFLSIAVFPGQADHRCDSIELDLTITPTK
jgi:hypothetical protein